ncbi:NAD(P)/FAD-dependent oxidoreductase [Paracoccus rhizosphaerae]|uniref:Thioredoxin reductase n=1 Tax=Paracoccus rhizosphaerae TaxID=1133347 RepID=A0ABV6CML0_9RHOB|nr:NAD(P)/FAD-dependent oxidoreductase [Paracoccus rhizosphaerae]
MHHDVIIIGGSYSGMSAALQLLRARRDVLIIDAGRPRNLSASHAHAVLGGDGMDREALHAATREQLFRYPTLRWHEGEATEVRGAQDDFQVTTDDGVAHRGRRVLLAIGVSDTLPAIPGMAEEWGRTVFHCPYCHGYELDQGPLAVVAIGARSLDQVHLLTDWGPVTVFCNRVLSLGQAVRADLVKAGITIEESCVSHVTPGCVHLQDGRSLPFAGIFTTTATAPCGNLARMLGCQLSELPTEQFIVTTDRRETTVPGAYACGDAALRHHSISLAMADGAWAGSQIHHDLVSAGWRSGHSPKRPL